LVNTDVFGQSAEVRVNEVLLYFIHKQKTPRTDGAKNRTFGSSMRAVKIILRIILSCVDNQHFTLCLSTKILLMHMVECLTNILISVSSILATLPQTINYKQLISKF